MADRCAFQMLIEEPAVRAYLQRYPFATGPAREMNSRGFEAIRRSFALRADSGDVSVTVGRSRGCPLHAGGHKAARGDTFAGARIDGRGRRSERKESEPDR